MMSEGGRGKERRQRGKERNKGGKVIKKEGEGKEACCVSGLLRRLFPAHSRRSQC